MRLSRSLALLSFIAMPTCTAQPAGKQCTHVDLTSGDIEKCVAVNIEWEALSAAQVENLIRALAAPDMRFLRLRATELSAEQSEAIMKAASLSTTLEHLIFRDHAFSTGAAKNLAALLAAGGKLKAVDLRDTALHDEGAIAVAKGLGQNQRLKFLTLEGCDLGPDGMASLGSAVANHPTLQAFHVHNNPIGDAGAVALGAAVQAQGAAGGPLQEVLVSPHPNIGKEGRAALQSAARANNEAVKMWDKQRVKIRKSWAHNYGPETVKEEL